MRNYFTAQPGGSNDPLACSTPIFHQTETCCAVLSWSEGGPWEKRELMWVLRKY